MSYVTKNLIDDERVLHTAKVSWWTAFWPVIIGVVLGIFTVIGVLVMVPALFRILTTEIAITNRRVIFKTGFISRKVLVLQYGRVEAMDMQQTVTGRLLKFGDMMLSGAGNRMVLKDIANPKELMSAYYRAETYWGNK